MEYKHYFLLKSVEVSVPDPGKGVCADPVNGGAILGKGGADPQGGRTPVEPGQGKGQDVIE
jgi:hypothetical protein